MGDPVAVGWPAEEGTRVLHSVSSEPVDRGPVPAELAERLAAALRAVRGYVPHHIWWEAGPAAALIEFQATQPD